MPVKPNTNTIACGSCGNSNAPDMSFCLSCGKVLSARMNALRKARGVKKRECASCKRSDELNNRYCIFCGAEILKRHSGQSNAEALEKFTQEISGLQNSQALTEAAQDTRKVAVSEIQKGPSIGLMPAFALYSVLGLVSALVIAFYAPGSLAVKIFALTAPVKHGLIVYTSDKYVNVVLQSADKKRYLMGSTGDSCSLALPDIAPGAYQARLSKEGFETILQSVDVQVGKLNVLGYASPITLPPSFTEAQDK